MSFRRVLSALSLAAVAAAQQGVWSPVPSDPGAPQWVTGLMTFDRARARTVQVYGSDVWEAAGTTWRRAASVANTGGFGGGFTYDHGRQRALWFGGFAFFSNTLIEWNGVGWTVVPTTHAPSPRADTAMTYDVARARVVLYGGWTSAGYLADTWEFDGIDWQQAFPPTSPPAMSRHRMAYDVAHGEVVLNFNQNLQSGTWLYDGSNWRQAPPGPPPMVSPALVYDEARARTVLTSSSSLNNPATTTWEWDGTIWTNAQPVGPAMTFAVNGAYDSVRGAVVLVADDGSGPTTMTWDGVQWRRCTPFGKLPSLPGAAAAYHANSRAPIAFGGDQGSLGLFSGQTREYRPGGWRLLGPLSAPSARGYAAMAAEPTGDVLLMGGRSVTPHGDTWRWDGTTWTQLAPATSPTPRSHHAMTLDAWRSRIVLFGGQNAAGTPLADTWEWDGTTWNLRTTTTAPAARVSPAMTFDVLRGRTLLFGGGTYATGFTDDLWQWDGSTWTQRTTAVRPAPRASGQFTFDPIGGVATLNAGFVYSFLGTNVVVADAWVWDDVSWTQVTGSAPTYDVNGLGVYHEELRSTLYSTGANLIANGSESQLALGSVAAVTTFGAGCPGAAGEPTLSALSVPRAGNRQFAFWIANAPRGTFAFVGFDWNTATIPLGNGCQALVPAPVFATTFTNALGSALVPFPIPPIPALHGLTLHGQGLALDPTGALAGLASLTAGLRVVLD